MPPLLQQYGRCTRGFDSVGPAIGAVDCTEVSVDGTASTRTVDPTADV